MFPSLSCLALRKVMEVPEVMEDEIAPRAASSKVPKELGHSNKAE